MRALQHLSDLGNKCFLGCGSGIFTLLLEQNNPSTITGIGWSEEMLVIHPIYSAMYPIEHGDIFQRMKSGL